ncbi:MAG: U32 family peptidase [Bacteroidales bacterium]|jgi:collagenase-like PrtC family protease|nr:U32 family peptidase [Bacteroidales bacterium]
MELTVGTKWDYDYIHLFNEIGVKEMFGSFRWSNLGTSRGGAVLPEVDVDFSKKYITKLHSLDMEFCYTMNSSCLGNKEFDPKHIKQMMTDFELLGEIGVDSITITIPSLIEIIRRNLPNVKIKCSVINQIGSVQSVQYFTEYLGVDEFVLGVDFNRNFKAIESIRKATNKKIEMLVNESCLYHCPYRMYHYNMAAHASKSDDPFNGKFIDYCIMNCMKQRVFSHREIIKGRFVRPEDIHIYEDYGIDRFKISSRHMPSEWAYRSAKAYSERKYEGNLSDIISPVAMAIPKESLHPMPGLTEEENERLRYALSFEAPNIYIDNSRLNGFLDFWINKKSDCDYMQCGTECDYCGKIAKRAITAEKDVSITENFIGFIDQTLDQVASGALADEEFLEIANLQWNELTKEKHEKCLTLVPILFRKIARKKTTKIAENYAIQRNSNIIEDQDMAKACYEQTPNHLKKKMVNILREINCDLYI